MNKEYIISKVKPFLNSENIIYVEDFDKLFSRLTKQQQYEIINTLISANIDIDYEGAKRKVASTEIGIATNRSSNTTRTALNTPTNITSSLKVDKLTNEQLCVIYQQGNKIALEGLITKNNRLVWSRVVKYSKRYKHKLDEEDLVQFGIMGLMKAAAKFDLKKEAKFTTYAIWWIDQSILRSIADYGFTVRIPIHYFEQVMRLMRILSQNTDCSKEEVFEVVKEHGIDRDKFEELLMIAENIMSLTSLNICVGEDEDSELINFKVDEITPSVEEQVEYIMLKETINENLNTLKKREKEILEKRFGLLDGVDRTLEDIGKEYNLTRERIRQIEAKALRRLRHPSRSKNLRNFFVG